MICHDQNASDQRMLVDLEHRDRELQKQDHWDRIDETTAGPVIPAFDYSPVQTGDDPYEER